MVFFWFLTLLLLAGSLSQFSQVVVGQTISLVLSDVKLPLDETFQEGVEKTTSKDVFMG